MGNSSHRFFDRFAIGSSDLPVGCQGANQSKLPIEIVVKADERHHTSVRKPRAHAYRRASEAPVSARAVAVIRPVLSIISLPRSFAPCLANAGCTLITTNPAQSSISDHFLFADDWGSCLRLIGTVAGETDAHVSYHPSASLGLCKQLDYLACAKEVSVNHSRVLWCLTLLPFFPLGLCAQQLGPDSVLSIN